MIKLILNKIKEKITSDLKNNIIESVYEMFEAQNQKNEIKQLALGTLLSNQQKLIMSEDINDFEFKIFSQWGDDGIIQYLIKNLIITNNVFIEFGVQDYMESNTRFLLMQDNWTGYIMDGSEQNIKTLKSKPIYWQYNLNAKKVWITKDNINKILNDFGIKNIGILSIDIDGNDYHILKEIDLTKINPSIIIVEYNSVFGCKRKISTIYNENFDRTKAHYSNLFFGASLPALEYICKNKGYSLVCCTKSGNNAYFVRKDLLNEKVKSKSAIEAFKLSQFRESRDEKYNLSFIGGLERYKLIKGLEVLNIETNKIEFL